MTHAVFASDKHVRVTGSGLLNAADCVAAIRRIAADAEHQPHFSVMVDIRAATYETPQPVGFIEVAGAMTALRTNFTGPIAVLAQGATLLAAETLATLVRVQSRLHMRVFVDQAAAESYCGLASDPHAPMRDPVISASMASRA